MQTERDGLFEVPSDIWVQFLRKCFYDHLSEYTEIASNLRDKRTEKFVVAVIQETYSILPQSTLVTSFQVYEQSWCSLTFIKIWLYEINIFEIIVRQSFNVVTYRLTKKLSSLR